MECFYCKGKLEDKLTNFTVDLGTSVIIVKGVPSQVCMQCGEVSYSDEVAQKLEKIVEKMKEVMTEIAVVQYEDALKVA
ncbi:MAG: type II toxin-antitoxin system MqsA family antitoxin [Lachnospiraceae bacterium]|nr:type II toxin-antitoxin system MqsA family antitoxin [Lachnospiraceae bacterium]